MISFSPNAKKIFPCLNCTNRKIGCHAKCEAYKKAVAENDRTNKKVREENVFITGKEPIYVTKKRTTIRNKGYLGREGIKQW